MACRCQERRAAITAAAKAKSIKAAASAASFVVRTVAEDAAKAVNIRRKSFKR